MNYVKLFEHMRDFTDLSENLAIQGHPDAKVKEEEEKLEVLHGHFDVLLYCLHKDSEATGQTAQKKTSISDLTFNVTKIKEKDFGKILKFSVETGSIPFFFKNGERLAIHQESKLYATGMVLYSNSKSIALTIAKINVKSDELEQFIKKCHDPEAQFVLKYQRSDYSSFLCFILKEYVDSEKEFATKPRKLINILLGVQKPQSHEIPIDTIDFYNKELNEGQQEAIEFSLNQKELAIIIGPPGTGKTVTLVEIILQEFNRKNKVIACAPSNVAADNLTERLSKYTKNILRVGHASKQNPNIIKYNVDTFLDRKFGRNRRNKKGKDSRLSKEDFRNGPFTYEEFLYLKHELPKISVIIGTISAFTKITPISKLLRSQLRVVVMDESCQATEPSCWLPIHFASKLVLAGDNNQLSATIFSNEKRIRDCLEYSLLERLDTIYRGKYTRRLNIQYRMNNSIMKWPNNRFYDNKLIAHPTVEASYLRDLEGVTDCLDSCRPIIIIDTQKVSAPETKTASKGNETEVLIVNKLIRNLQNLGVQTQDIAVITPYSHQVNLICASMNDEEDKVEVATVDKFQGREKEVIIFSMVRCNKKAEVGFVRNMKRINVAITRAKKMFIVISHTTTMNKHSVLRGFLHDMIVNGKLVLIPYDGLEEYLESDDLTI